MKRLLLGTVTCVALAAGGGIASAADMPVKAPVVAPVYSWIGFYIGANVGGGWGSRRVDYSPNDPATVSLFNSGGAPPNASFASSGALGGLQAGYNWQIDPRWLIGAEADFDWSGMKGSATTNNIFITLGASPPISNAVEERIKWLGTLRGRLGYLPAPDLLAFVTGGFAYGEVQHTGNYNANSSVGVNAGSVSFNCAAVPCFSGSSSTVAVGWTLGGGLEYVVWQNWTLKAEYLYVSLSGKSLTETALATFGSTAPASFNASYSRTNFNVARMGLNWRF